MKRLILTVLFLAVSAGYACADDPAMFTDGTNCAVGWCAGDGSYVDPSTGTTTLMFAFKPGALTNIVTGDVAIYSGSNTSSSVVGLLRFEDLTSGAFAGDAVAFLYTDIDGGPADVGLPSYSTAYDIFNASSGSTTLWNPTSTEAGYSATGTYAHGTYGVEFVKVTPEPGPLLLLGTGMLLLLAMRRWAV